MSPSPLHIYPRPGTERLFLWLRVVRVGYDHAAGEDEVGGEGGVGVRRVVG